MIRNLAVAGGRPPKNEDFTLYIQAFTILESLFAELNHGVFILSGVEITNDGGGNYDWSSGIVYADGELCVFDGITGSGVTSLTFDKVREGVNPREFQDDVVRNTREKVKLIQGSPGSIQMGIDTPRATDKFLRSVNGLLSAPIDANNNEKTNLWKSVLSDRAEMSRQIPKPTGTNRYLKIGTLPISDTQGAVFFLKGLGANTSYSGFLTVNRNLFFASDSCVGTMSFIGLSNADTDSFPLFYSRRNDGASVFEIWVKSPNTLFVGDLSSGAIQLLSESFTNNDTNFVFADSFVWSTSNPGSLFEFSQETFANKAEVAQNANDIAQNANDIAQNTSDIADNTAKLGAYVSWAATVDSSGNITKQAVSDPIVIGDIIVSQSGTGSYFISSNTVNLQNRSWSLLVHGDTILDKVRSNFAFTGSTQILVTIEDYSSVSQDRGFSLIMTEMP